MILSRSGPHVEVQIDFDWRTSTFTEYGNADYDLEDDPDADDDEDIHDDLRRYA